MIKKEYERLLGVLEQTSAKQGLSLEEILREAVVFFEALRKEFPSASKEEKDEMIQMMTHIHGRLQDIASVTAKASGMTEEELNVFAENPSNFSPEQWQLIQKSRRELYDTARQFSAAVDNKKIQHPEDKALAKKKSAHPPIRRARRQDWTKS